jgi:hypothetical protein
MPRPPLTKTISINDLTGYYWLKEELIDFCRGNGISASGSKQELFDRVRLYLETGEKPQIKNKAAPGKERGSMPKVFTRQSVIGPGWHCSQEIRYFFEKEIGADFHFDGIMRDLIYHGAGLTLDEVIESWNSSRESSSPKKEIAPQFEYNRHIRAYFAEHKGATLADAIEAWKKLKALNRDGNSE